MQTHIMIEEHWCHHIEDLRKNGDGKKMMGEHLSFSGNSKVLKTKFLGRMQNVLGLCTVQWMGNTTYFVFDTIPIRYLKSELIHFKIS